MNDISITTIKNKNKNSTYQKIHKFMKNEIHIHILSKHQQIKCTFAHFIFVYFIIAHISLRRMPF